MSKIVEVVNWSKKMSINSKNCQNMSSQLVIWMLVFKIKQTCVSIDWHQNGILPISNPPNLQKWLWCTCWSKVVGAVLDKSYNPNEFDYDYIWKVRQHLIHMYRIYRDPLEDGKDNSESDAHVCVGVFFRFAQSWNPESTSTKKQRKGGVGGVWGSTKSFPRPRPFFPFSLIFMSNRGPRSPFLLRNSLRTFLLEGSGHP